MSVFNLWFKFDSMANCPTFSTELNQNNIPSFGFGRLSTGEQICSECYSDLISINPTSKSKIKNNLVQVDKLSQEELTDPEKLRRKS